MMLMFNPSLPAASAGLSNRMHEALTQGLGTGSTLALWAHLLGLDRAPSPLAELCPVDHWRLHLPSLALGLLLGLLLGPILDALVALRILVYHSLTRGAEPLRGPVHSGPLPAGRRPPYRLC